MTERQCKELLREEILPVILGNGRAAHRLCQTIRLHYRLSSLVCGECRTLWDRLDPFAFFYPVIEGSPALLSEQLQALSHRYEGCLLILIPATEEDARRLAPIGSELESDYILASPSSLQDKLPAALRQF